MFRLVMHRLNVFFTKKMGLPKVVYLTININGVIAIHRRIPAKNMRE